MKINPINNNYTSFGAKFKSSEALNKSLEKASRQDKKNFKNLLKRMQTKNDNLVYSVDSHVYASPYHYDKKLFIELLEDNESKRTLQPYCVGEEFVPHKEEFEGRAFNNVIKNINTILEEKYPIV